MKRPASNLEEIEAFTEHNRYRTAGRAVGRVQVNFKNGNRRGTCTASIITENLVLTARHCLRDEEYPDNSVDSMTLYMDDVGTDGGTPFTITKEAIESDSNLDFAIFRSDGNPGLSFGTVQVEARTLKRGEELFVVHHPEGTPQKVSRRACRARGPHTKNNFNFFHICDTTNGSSGAPVFSDNSEKPIVLGIHQRYEILDGHILNVGASIESIAKKSCIVSKLIDRKSVSECGLATSVVQNSSQPGSAGQLSPTSVMRSTLP